MSFKLIETTIKKAPERAVCDACRCFKERGSRELIFKADLVIYLKYKSGYIEPGTDYVEHLIVDEDTGEIGALNAIPKMNTVVLRNNLYPSNIINQLKK